MGRVEDMIARIEIKTGNKTHQIIEPQIRKFYQKDGVWYAVVQFIVGGSETNLHVAVG